ncbi:MULTISPECIES: autotransporter domain-containing protein [Vitreoscilla]|uniref:Autotransporter domain-containing protein n=1 Tax=Vitreoscilla stercoraria TaxID=61 RepID=A0ABY4E888_VITST|nr:MULTISPECIES: autotransporter domain-containing protein [Vitreoscilla]AUZ04283.2 GDSL-like lipase/acylhydrolase [Vitreoscilla sp. C1]UOO91972.1 autotransporter domain-containing protein [Vitreoscilla stercoraria]
MKTTYLAACVACLGLSVLVQAQPFSNTYFMGDSLTDSGQFMGQRFTTNPGQVWSQHLAAHLGGNANPSRLGGNNYAVGGARVGEDTSDTVAGVTVAIPSIKTQIAQLKASQGGKLDSRALYAVWGGANDLFAITAGAPAQATMTAAIIDHTTAIHSLSSAGATYILVPNLPNLGMTPAFRGNEAAGTQLSQTYNQALYEPFIKNSVKTNIIPLDIYSLLDDVSKNPASYGFKNVTTPACGTTSSVQCGPAQLLEPNADQTYLFADGVHPTSKAHEVVGQYAAAVLQAPAQMAVLGRAANQAGLAQMQHVDRRLHNIAPLQDGKTAVWVQGGVALGSGNAANSELDGAGGKVVIGVDKRLGEWTVGTYVAHDSIDGKTGHIHQYDQQRLAGGVYGRWQSGSAWVNAQAYYANLDVDTQRQLALGNKTQNHQASGDGDQYGVRLMTGLNWQHGDLSHGPVVGVSMQKASIDRLQESGADFSAMTFDALKQESVQSSLGYQMAYQINPKWDTFASLQWQREFKDGVDKVGAHLNSMDALHFEVPVNEDKARNSGLLELGVNGKINEQWHLGAGVNAQFGDAVNAQTAVYLNTSYRF